MSNSITFGSASDPNLVMSNALTAVFIDALCLTGGKIARRDSQKEIMVRLARMDASIRGDGFTGFSLESLFQGLDAGEGSRFLQVVCKAVLAESRWNGLPYSPDVKLLHQAIGRFNTMLQKAEDTMIAAANVVPVRAVYRQCPVHGAYMHESGCVICNNS